MWAKHGTRFGVIICKLGVDFRDKRPHNNSIIRNKPKGGHQWQDKKPTDF